MSLISGSAHNQIYNKKGIQNEMQKARHDALQSNKNIQLQRGQESLQHDQEA